MNDEIKEILDLLNFNRDTISNRICRVEDFMSREEIIKLLDYITNLQKENSKLISENEAIKSIKYTVDEVIYKSRNDNAIEYIENELFKGKDDLEWCRKNDGTISGSDLPAYCILDLYDILKGDDKNEKR